MASSPVPRIIVLALGAGALGLPEALRVLLDVAGRSPLTDIAICVFAVAVVTAQALGATLLARFVRKARAGSDAPAPPPRTDRFAQVTLVVSLGVACLVSACLLVASGAGAGGLGPLYLVAADVARKMKSPVIAALAAVLLPCARPLLRVLRREEDHSDGPAAAAAAGMGRFASMTQTQVASFTVTGAAAFLLYDYVSGSLYLCTQRGSLSLVGAVLLARFTFTRRRARNAAAGAGGRAAPTPAAGTRRLRFGRLARLAPYLPVVSFAALICCLVLTTY